VQTATSAFVEILRLIHSDIMEVQLQRWLCVINFTDDYSRALCHEMKHEALQGNPPTVQGLGGPEQFGARIKRFLTDNGREYLPSELISNPGELGFDASPPYCKGQNGLAERSLSGADQHARCGNFSFLVDRMCWTRWFTPEAARAASVTEEDAVRNAVWPAAQAVASATY